MRGNPVAESARKIMYVSGRRLSVLAYRMKNTTHRIDIFRMTIIVTEHKKLRADTGKLFVFDAKENSSTLGRRFYD